MLNSAKFVPTHCANRRDRNPNNICVQLYQQNMRLSSGSPVLSRAPETFDGSSSIGVHRSTLALGLYLRSPLASIGHRPRTKSSMLTYALSLSVTVSFLMVS